MLSVITVSCGEEAVQCNGGVAEDVQPLRAPGGRAVHRRPLAGSLPGRVSFRRSPMTLPLLNMADADP